MGKWKDPNPEWPVPVRKRMDDGTVDTQYPANTKEYDKLVGDPADGGKGYTPQAISTDYPKTMSHPTLADLSVPSPTAEKAAMKKGYSFDHWANKMEKEARANIDKAEASTEFVIDPKSQYRIDQLEAKLAEQSAQIEKLLEALGAKT